MALIFPSAHARQGDEQDEQVEINRSLQLTLTTVNMGGLQVLATTSENLVASL